MVDLPSLIVLSGAGRVSVINCIRWLLQELRWSAWRVHQWRVLYLLRRMNDHWALPSISSGITRFAILVVDWATHFWGQHSLLEELRKVFDHWRLGLLSCHLNKLRWIFHQGLFFLDKITGFRLEKRSFDLFLFAEGMLRDLAPWRSLAFEFFEVCRFNFKQTAFLADALKLASVIAWLNVVFFTCHLAGA